jgi:hypothetical protein
MRDEVIDAGVGTKVTDDQFDANVRGDLANLLRHRA